MTTRTPCSATKAGAEFDGFVQRFWIPVWSVPPGEEAPRQVLRYPVCLLVVTAGYPRFYGVTTGLSTTTLTGNGWAVGVMCAPAAGLLAKVPVAASPTGCASPKPGQKAPREPAEQPQGGGDF